MCSRAGRFILAVVSAASCGGNTVGGSGGVSTSVSSFGGETGSAAADGFAHTHTHTHMNMRAGGGFSWSCDAELSGHLPAAPHRSTSTQRLFTCDGVTAAAAQTGHSATC